ncbi:MAG TPA: glycerol-3-phosphate 1-O-acyltransferase PlsY [Candidatus Acidoferrales bacterium]|jgi:glycerol-3-phosphate acyltransferase PlsY|nr:glycerol-3-phosphate 1-O-acyltransferase PlsY [Candidatus Acidoferrales bacterium]
MLASPVTFATFAAFDLSFLNVTVLIPVVAYILGSIPFGLIIVKAFGGADIRSVGSGNIGAANVTRNAGPIAGALTLLLDAAKGYFAVWLAGHWTGWNIRWMMLGAIFAVIGHVFPVWLQFRGGKGVATGLGVFILICWQAVAAAVLLWLIVVVFWRYSSLGSIAAAAAMPILVYVLYAPGHAPSEFVSLGTILIAVLILAKHRSNIERLIAGEEPRLKFRR